MEIVAVAMAEEGVAVVGQGVSGTGEGKGGSGTIEEAEAAAVLATEHAITRVKLKTGSDRRITIEGEDTTKK